MSIYDELGIPRLINGNATLTRLGGSRLAPGVAAAMEEAGRDFVDIPALQAAIGTEIARLTGNEACYVASGAAAALTLITAVCVTRGRAELREKLPFTDDLPNEVIVHRHTRVGYDFGIRMAGVRLVEIGGPNGTTADELRRALNPRTAAMFYFPRGTTERGELPLETAVEICRPLGVPVIVDAAAQLPPRSNLWSFTRRGADIAIFSGGKGLRGPQSTGLILGRRELIEACAPHAAPNPFICRGMKVGKEELCGILTAVRWYLAQDEAAESAFFERAVAEVVAGLQGIAGVAPCRDFPNEAGQPVPRALIQLDPTTMGRSRDELLAALRAGAPSIDLAAGSESSFYVNPQTLEPEEVSTIVRRIREELIV